MTRKRTIMTILAGLALVIAGPALAYEVVPYPEFEQVFTPGLIDPPDGTPRIPGPTDPGERPFPLPIGGVNEVSSHGDASSPARGSSWAGNGAIGTQLLGSTSGSEISRPDLESILRAARRNLDE